MIQIPFDNQGLYTSVSQEIILDGTTYLFEFEYSVAFDLWRLSISLKSGASIVQGLCLVCMVPLLHSAVSPHAPRGRLFVLRGDGSVKTPGLAELGSIAKIWYLAEGETV